MGRNVEIRDYSGVFAAVAGGMSISDACAACGLSPSTFHKDRMGSPYLRQKLMAAQELGAEAIADSLLNIHERVRDPLMARVVSENRRWLLSHFNAQRFGEKAKQDDGRGDLTAILKEAIARIPRPQSDQPATIEADNVTISDIFD